MTLPRLDAAQWGQRDTRPPYFDELLRLADAATDASARQDLYAQLTFVVTLDTDARIGPLEIGPTNVKRWKAVLPELHRAFYGFAPGEQRDIEALRRVFPALSATTYDAVVGLCRELGDRIDGASVGQLSKKLVTEARKRKLSLDAATAFRLVAALEGMAIPPP